MPNDLSSPVLDIPAGATAVLHGMMGTLSEVLGGIDGRIAALERQLREARAESGSPRALAETVEAAVARLAERIEAIEAVVTRPVARDEALWHAVESLRQSVDALAVRPIRDDDLHAAVAALADRPAVDEELRAAVASLAARPPAVDDELRSVVASLAARPAVDEELRAAVASLAARPPAIDEELRAAVAALAAKPVVDDELRAMVAGVTARLDEELRPAVRELTELAARPVVDEQVRAALTRVEEQLAARPAVDEELRAALGELAAKPAADEELRAAVARLEARAAEPVPVPGPDHPVRAALSSLHERLNVILDVVAQPAKPDDAVRMGLGAVESELAQVRERIAASDEEMSTALRLALTRLSELATALEARPEPNDDRLVEQLETVAAALTDHPAARLNEAMARVEEQVAGLVAQPGPGPAMAMVAAGLAERFETRTGALVDLLTTVTGDLAALATTPAAIDGMSARMDEVAATLTHAAASLPASLSADRDAFAARLEDVATLLTATAGALPDLVAERVDAAAAGLPDLVGTRLDDVRSRIDAAASALASTSASLPEALAADRESLAAKLDAIAAAANERLDAATSIAAGLPDALAEATASIPEALAADRTGIAERLDLTVVSFATAAESLRSDLAARLDRVDAVPEDLAGRVQSFIEVQFAELARREDAVATALHDLRAGVERAGADPALAGTVDRVRQVVEGQQGDVVAMRDALRSLFDSVERQGSVSAQVAELLLENRAAVAREVERLQSIVTSNAGELAERVRDATQTMRADVQAMAATGEDPRQLDAVADRISESVRRESELLTQRVAALSVAVEALRSMLDAHVEETSNSIGRKASEVGRKLAADFGIRNTAKKPPAKSGPKDRSIGPGSGGHS